MLTKQILLLIFFWLNSLFALMLLMGAIWSVAYPALRLWPIAKNRKWASALVWFLYAAVFLFNLCFMILDWNSWLFTSPARLMLGIPTAMAGGSLAAWGIANLGIRNTSGFAGGFVETGPYRFTRNPQYLGCHLLFVGLSIIANSHWLWIIHGLLILVFLIAPLAEEDWLEEQYGEIYSNYKIRTPRFL